MANAERIVDCHAHIIDPERFPFTGSEGLPAARRTSAERARNSARCSTSTASATRVLVQLSGYGTDNSANLDAMQGVSGPLQGDRRGRSRRRATGRSRTWRPPASSACGSTSSATTPTRCRARDAPRLAAAAQGAGLVRADLCRRRAMAGRRRRVASQRRPGAGRSFRRARHRRRNAPRRDSRRCWRWAARASRRRSSRRCSACRACSTGFDDLDPFVDELLQAFGVDGCIWGSDWPFINVPRRRSMPTCWRRCRAGCRTPPTERACCAHNPRRLFGFGD